MSQYIMRDPDAEVAVLLFRGLISDPYCRKCGGTWFRAIQERGSNVIGAGLQIRLECSREHKWDSAVTGDE